MSRTQRVSLLIAVAGSILIAAVAVLPHRMSAQTPASKVTAAGKRGVILDNDRVIVQRVTQPAGTIEKPHPHPEADYLSIQLTPGDLEVTIANQMTKGSQGTVWYLPKGTIHTMNNPGTTPVEVIVVTFK